MNICDMGHNFTLKVSVLRVGSYLRMTTHECMQVPLWGLVLYTSHMHDQKTCEKVLSFFTIRQVTHMTCLGIQNQPFL